MDGFIIIYCTTPDMECARSIAHYLVENNLAACCNLIPAVESIYRWQDKIVQDQEVLILIKTTSSQFQRIEQAVTDLHPYEIPEIIATPIREGSELYLDWIKTTLEGAVNNGT